MEAIGPDEVDEEELKRAKTWRDIRAELTRGVKPSWSGKSARNTREWKASLEQKLSQKIVPGAVNGLLLAVYDASVDETAAGLLRLRVLKSGAAEEREARPDPMSLPYRPYIRDLVLLPPPFRPGLRRRSSFTRTPRLSA